MAYECKKDYEALASGYGKWLTEKEVPLEALAEGINIDFRDKDYFWVSARIVKIKQKKTMTLRYTKNGSSHTETIPFGNERIAQPNTILCLK